MTDGLPEQHEEPKPKKIKPELDEGLAGQIDSLRNEALQVLIDQMQEGTEAIYKSLYGSEWEDGAKFEAAKTAKRQAEAQGRMAAAAELKRKREENETVSLTGTGVYLDDFDPRY